MIRAGVIGATGYAGAELVRLLLNHPQISHIAVSYVSFEGQNLTDIYTNLFQLCNGTLCGKSSGILDTADDVVSASDVIFTALPHGVAEKYADRCIKEGKKLIDLSADFRFWKNEALFKQWYKKTWEYPDIHAESVYGLPEMYRTQIKTARIVGNPGCYVTSATLGLLPALKTGCIRTENIVIDSKSGVTGAGRNPTMVNQFCECGESFCAYAVGGHRHLPEIVQNCNDAAGKSCSIVFTPHLVPMSRGILSTIYAPLVDSYASSAGEATSELRSLYRNFYKDEPFVRVLADEKSPATRNVRGSNYCDIQVYAVANGTMLQIVSVLDNMVKGASGQAIQNMNLMYGFDETAGLNLIPAAF